MQKVCIWTPDKDLAQCVRGDRVVQVDRRAKKIRNAEGVREKFGVAPGLIPDFLALVGDAADGYPGIAGIGPVTAARLLNLHGSIEDFPPDVLGEGRGLALLFKDLATLRTDAQLFRAVDDLRWRGRSYDRFNGMQWVHSFPTPPSSAPRAWYRERWQGPTIEQRIFAAPLDARVLFALHPVLRLDADRRIAPMYDQAGDLLYLGSAAPAYTARSMTAPPSPDELRLACERMRVALNEKWPRRSLGWQSPAAVWATRQPIRAEVRDAFQEEVYARAQKLDPELEDHDLAMRLAIEQALQRLGYLRTERRDVAN